LRVERSAADRVGERDPLAKKAPVEAIEVRLVIGTGGESPSNLHRGTTGTHDLGLDQLLPYVTVVDVKSLLLPLHLGCWRQRRRAEDVDWKPKALDERL
jgi:hypothetical protein